MSFLLEGFHMPNPMRNNYFEATIQLRPFDQTIMEYIIKEVNNRKGVFIANVEELKTGIDIFLSSQKFARALGKKLKQRFKGTLTISRKMHKLDRQTGVLLYRATVLFRLKQ